MLCRCSNMSKFRTLFNQKGGSQRAAVEANRDHDVQLDAALGELIDNSIEHGQSKNINIITKMKRLKTINPNLLLCHFQI